MQDKEKRLKQQMQFALEIDKAKNVFRQTHLSGYGRKENVAEHSWHIALMAYTLKEYSNEEIDVAKVIVMCLLHDVVEIIAGDTYAYDTENKESQAAREDEAKEVLFSLLPEDQKQEFIALFDEFNAEETAEAKFARAMDNIQPIVLNNSNGGQDWISHKVQKNQVLKRQEITKAGSKVLYDYAMKIVDEHTERGNLIE
ncbi:MAG: HD domain-containing protein [Clostridiaceae bacterium]|nr:HD domain-containing protein [Clostridiaceae bacterium]